jgi:glycosyltransferase involved in cell wall biosynthesis
MKAARLAIISTHPIQYNAPLFEQLANNGKLQVKVFYTWSQSQTGAKYDSGFGRVINWDIPLLSGYDYEFVENVSPAPGTGHFKGIDNPQLIEKVAGFEPTTILLFGWAFKSHLALMRHFKGKVPILFRGDSTLLNESGLLKKTARRIFLTWVYRYVDYALYVGANNKDYFLKHGLKEKQLVLAPHAVDNNRFFANGEQLQKDVVEWRSELGLSDKDFVVLFAGKLEDNKNPFLILEAAEQLKDEHVKFVIVGNGELEGKLKETAAANKNVIFVDFQNQGKMPLVYRLGDAFILPSQSETWGLAINEAMACGRAVIASDRCGGAIDLIENGYNGYVFPHANVEGLVTAVREVKKNHAEMGRRSADRIKKWSFDNIVYAIEGLVAKL